jgi:hypothetical protein
MTNREILLLIHGTGAGEEGEVGKERWWQPDSLFTRTLGAALRVARPDKTIEITPFKWSGANSEFSRRQAGLELSERLDDYEQQGIDYHLIGHSHGGSVIWYALIDAAKRARARTHLRSWITVGTPFLSFVPRSRIFALVVSALLLASVGLLASFWTLLDGLALDLRMLLADAPLWALLLILLAPASLIVSIIWFVITLFAHARTVRREAISSAADRSLKALGEHYVPLWHPLDEPISGLSASLSRPPAIAPRAPIQGRPWIRSLLPQIYNHTVAPIIDSLVWWVITGRLQGRDVGGLVLSSCSALPPRVIGRKNLLSGELQQQISSQADSLASQSAVRLRLALNEIGARRKPLASLAQAISWQEVVHTSYFDHARFAEACSELILDQMSGARAEPDAPRLDAPLPESTVTSTSGGDSEPSYFEPRALYVLLGVGILAVLLLATVTSRTAWQGFGLPLTSRFQIELIAANALKPDFSRLWDSPALGDIAARLVAMDRLDDPMRLIRSIDNPNTSIRALQRIAYAYGFLGKHDAIDGLIGTVAEEKLFSTEADLPFYIKAFALSGALDAKRPEVDKLASALMSKIESADYHDLFRPYSSPRFWFAELLRTTQAQRLLEVAAKWECLEIEQIIQDQPAEIYADAMARLRTRCDVKQTEKMPGVQRASLSTEDLVARFNARDPTALADVNEYEVASEITKVFEHGDKDRVIAFLRAIIGKEEGNKIINALDDGTTASIVVLAKGRSEHAELGRRIVALIEENAIRRINEQEFYGFTRVRQMIDSVAEQLAAMQEATALRRLASHFDPAKQMFYENHVISGMFWLKAGDARTALEQFRSALTAIEKTRLGERAFPDAMTIAELAAPHDRALARAAVETAMRVLGAALRVDSVPSYAYSVDDGVAVLARIGEFRRARELAESIGRPLTAPPVQESESQQPVFEKSALQGQGVLGGYRRILDAWIERAGTGQARDLIRRQNEWPGTFEMVPTTFNRG